jgi:SWI/SNF-related matrix-associated actin-dependent regulator 1 of chromatin subfamily A
MPDGVSKLDGITLIADEAHFLGNYKSQRSKKVTALSKLFAKRVLFLTGTPLTRDPSTLWSVLGAAGVQREAFGSWTNFTKVFGGRKNRWGGMEWGSPAPIVPELLRRVMLRRMRSEVLPQLPPKRYTDLIVNGLSATLRSTLDTIWGDQGDLLTVTQDLPGFEEFSKVRAELAAAKIPALLEMVQEHEDQDVPLVVCSDHRAPVEALENRPGWGVIKGGMDLKARDAVVEAFQTGNLKGVAFTITAGGVGITLTRAWKMLMVDLNWTPANVLQAEDRLVRIGQHAGSVEITRLVIDHPLEQHIHGIVAKKIALAQASLDDSINAKKLPAPQAPVNGAVRNETQDEYDIRMEAIRQADALAEQKAQEEAEATLVQRCKNRVSVILEREQAKNPGYVQNKKYLTPTRVASIRTGIAYMSSICDGAISRDNQGFNKSDTGLGKILATTGLMTVEELRCSELILLRYPRQVSLSD